MAIVEREPALSARCPTRDCTGTELEPETSEQAYIATEGDAAFETHFRCRGCERRAWVGFTITHIEWSEDE